MCEADFHSGYSKETQNAIIPLMRAGCLLRLYIKTPISSFVCLIIRFLLAENLFFIHFVIILVFNTIDFFTSPTVKTQVNLFVFASVFMIRPVHKAPLQSTLPEPKLVDLLSSLK